MKPVEVEIDTLVLIGFARADRYRIAEAVQQSLAKIVASQGTFTQSHQIDLLDAGAFRTSRAATPAELGAGIGTALGGAFRASRPAMGGHRKP